MSLSFSIILYQSSAEALNHQLPPDSLFQDDRLDRQGRAFSVAPQVNAFLQDRIAESRQQLMVRVIMVNTLVLIVGGWLSYYLARRTLQPIEANMEAQSQFVSDASHELRTPLTALQTTNEVALRNKRLSLLEARTVLEQNVEEVAKLQALTNGLLKLARTDGQVLARDQVSLADLVSGAINRVIPQAQQKHITINDDVQRLTLLGDRQNLEQAVVVLLDNAIKYSLARSVIAIKAGQVAKAKQVWIQVIDHGVGIRPYDLRKVFDRFYRADQSRSAQHIAGYGIGLALAKKIVEQHGGEIVVQSSVGQGSTFIIKIPV